MDLFFWIMFIGIVWMGFCQDAVDEHVKKEKLREQLKSGINTSDGTKETKEISGENNSSTETSVRESQE